MTINLDTSPDGADAQAAYRRLQKAIANCQRLALLPERSQDLRYAVEVTSKINCALSALLIRQGVITQEELGEIAIGYINELAAIFERRVDAYLAGKRDMPQ